MSRRRKYVVTVEVSITKQVTVWSEGWGPAAKCAELAVRSMFPQAQYRDVQAKQVDFRTREGGESHYYPPPL